MAGSLDTSLIILCYKDFDFVQYRENDLGHWAAAQALYQGELKNWYYHFAFAFQEKNRRIHCMPFNEQWV